MHKHANMRHEFVPRMRPFRIGMIGAKTLVAPRTAVSSGILVHLLFQLLEVAEKRNDASRHIGISLLDIPNHARARVEHEGQDPEREIGNWLVKLFGIKSGIASYPL